MCIILAIESKQPVSIAAPVKPCNPAIHPPFTSHMLQGYIHHTFHPLQQQPIPQITHSHLTLFGPYTIIGENDKDSHFFTSFLEPISQTIFHRNLNSMEM